MGIYVDFLWIANSLFELYYDRLFFVHLSSNVKNVKEIHILKATSSLSIYLFRILFAENIHTI